VEGAKRGGVRGKGGPFSGSQHQRTNVRNGSHQEEARKETVGGKKRSHKKLGLLPGTGGRDRNFWAVGGGSGIRQTFRGDEGVLPGAKRSTVK